MNRDIHISDYDYDLPEERIAKFPLPEREASKLLVWRDGVIEQRTFAQIGDLLPEGTLLVFNNTRVVRARLLMQRSSGARIEVFCLEPHAPADYEHAFAAKGACSWVCIVGGVKKWKPGEAVFIEFGGHRLEARRGEAIATGWVVEFAWDAEMTFGQLLETLGRTPIPPYLNRESEALDEERYQTCYAEVAGSVAAPTAGLHFSQGVMAGLHGVDQAFVTLHVGAGTFLPVKNERAADHPMHTEHIEIPLETLLKLREKLDHIASVGTTSVRTLESLMALGYRIVRDGDPCLDEAVGQWELYDIPPEFAAAEALDALIAWMRGAGCERLMAATRIMIMPGYGFRLVDMLITNFHQPRSTLLLLVSAFTGGRWRAIYDYALARGFRFLSYGDSSILFRCATRR